uniref:Histone deacetylase complex subunit SAP30 Sin3 binding domain-containing protein n=1 Tax=Meloidogyne incognita TaxID=6306 RepID=A0A914N5F3_MELIC
MLQDLSTRCAIYTKQQDGTFTQCENFAFTPINGGIQFDKNIPFFVEEADISTLFICRPHYLLIQNPSEFNNLNNQINRQKEEEDFIEEFTNFVQQISNKKQINFNQSEEYLKSQLITKNLLEKYRKPVNCAQMNESARNRFDALSTTALRRYKKFFKLPNRSGAISKQQLLDGINEHFSNIVADPKEVMTNFMFAINHKLNCLDSSSEENK